MKILHILGSQFLPSDPDNSGVSGVVRVALEIAYRQVKLGHEITILGLDTHPWQKKWKGVNLVCKSPIPFAKISILGDKFDFSIHLPYIIYTNVNRFDLIHAHYGYLRFLKAKFRVVHFHADPFYNGFSQNKKLKLNNKDFKLIENLSDAQIVVSKFIAGQVALGIQDYSRCFTILNGVDIKNFNANVDSRKAKEIKRDLDLQGEEILVLFVGAITPEKGLLHLANAFIQLADKHPKIHLLVAGAADLWGNNILLQSSEYEKEVFETLKKYIIKNRVHFLGKVNTNDLPFVYQASDFVIVPSVVQEAFSLVALESLASGRPVIASNVGGIPEIVNHNNGILVTPGDEKELENAIIKLASNQLYRYQLGKCGRKTAEALTWERMVEKVEEVYQYVQENNPHEFSFVISNH